MADAWSTGQLVPFKSAHRPHIRLASTDEMMHMLSNVQNKPSSRRPVLTSKTSECLLGLQLLGSSPVDQHSTALE
jgi:hypothetical protein